MFRKGNVQFPGFLFSSIYQAVSVSPKKQIRRDIGKYIRKLRLEHRMSLNEVIAYLSLYRIECSKSNLNRIEIENTPVRSDILAGLALVFETSTDSIVYRQGKEKA